MARAWYRFWSLKCLAAVLVGSFLLFACSGASPSGDQEKRSEETEEEGKDSEVVWINELTSADTILVNDDLTGSMLAELDGLGRKKSETALYPYGFARYDTSQATNVYSNTPRDRSVGLDHMGSRLYSPELGVWTSADPAVLTKPEQYVTAEFAAANPYAYANLRPVIAADRDGQFWHIAGGAVGGALIGGGVEAMRQYLTHGKVEDWGRVGAAAGGGAVSGALTAANPAASLASVMSSNAGANVVGGITTRLMESGSRDAGNLTDVLVDATVGAATAGVVKGGSSVLKKVAAKKPAAPPASQGGVATIGTPAKSQAIQPYYPANNGFMGATSREFLRVGQQIDRYGGSEYSRFFSPVGTPAAARAMPPGTSSQPLQRFMVQKPLEVEVGTVAPAFGEVGLGMQMRTPIPLGKMLETGILMELAP